MGGAVRAAAVDWDVPALTAYQERALFGPARYAIIEATTKAGKTFGALVWLFEQGVALGRPGREFWWVAPIFDQAKIAYRRLKQMLSDADPQRADWTCNETELSITLRGGGTYRFKGSDKPDSLYGEDVWACVIDEASRCREESFHAVRSTLTATRGQIRIIGNVKGRKNWFFRMARKAEAGEPDMQFARITAVDAVHAGILDEGEVQDAKRHLPEAVFRELYLAEASDDAGNPFGFEAIQACLSSLSNERAEVWGIDLAKSVDWTVAIALDRAGRVCRFERWQAPWQETLDRVSSLVTGARALVDSTGVGDPIVEQLQRRMGSGVSGFKFTSESKQRIMEGLAVSIQQGRVRFPNGPIRAELEAFEFEYTRTGVRYSAPSGSHDDCVCALALAVSGSALGSGFLRASSLYTGSVRSREREEVPEWAL